MAITHWPRALCYCFVAENFVIQQLIASRIGRLHGWQKETAEIEFVKDLGDFALPIEVKAGSVTRAKSLQSFIDRYHPKRSLILSTKMPKLTPLGKGGLILLPVYCAELASSVIDASLQSTLSGR